MSRHPNSEDRTIYLFVFLVALYLVVILFPAIKW